MMIFFLSLLLLLPIVKKPDKKNYFGTRIFRIRFDIYFLALFFRCCCSFFLSSVIVWTLHCYTLLLQINFKTKKKTENRKQNCFESNKSRKTRNIYIYKVTMTCFSFIDNWHFNNFFVFLTSKIWRQHK